MQSKKYILPELTLFLFLLLLFFFPTQCLDGASKGLLLWFHTVLPTLFPFLFLSSLMMSTGFTYLISRILRPVLCPLLRIKEGSCYAVMIGLFSGYPLGAKTCADLVRKGEISKGEGQYLLAFCNNASPMFLLSFIAIQTLKLPSQRYLLLGIILSSAVLSAFLFRLFHPYGRIPGGKEEGSGRTAAFRFEFPMLDEAVGSALSVIAKVGGYIILFSLLGTVASSFTFLPELFRIALCGILEITNGASLAGTSGMAESLKIVLVCTITAFGGLSSAFQTKSVISGSGLSLRQYLLTKCINALLAALLSYVFVRFLL